MPETIQPTVPPEPVPPEPAPPAPAPPPAPPLVNPEFLASHQKMSDAMALAASKQQLQAETLWVEFDREEKRHDANVWRSFALAVVESRAPADTAQKMLMLADELFALYQTRFD